MTVSSIDEFYARAPHMVAQRLGATSHCAGVLHSGELERDAPHSRGAYSPENRVVLVPQDAHARMAAIFQPSAVLAIHRNPDREAFDRKVVKADMQQFLANVIQSCGPHDPQLMRAEWDAYFRHPHLQPWMQGTAEASAELLLNPVLRSLGMPDELIAATPIQTAFFGPAAMMRGVAHEVSSDINTRWEVELLEVARWGGSRLGMWRMAARWAHTDRFGEGLGGPGAVAGIRRGIDTALEAVASEWAVVDPEHTTPEPEASLGERWGMLVGRHARLEMRRWLAGQDGVADPAILARALAVAAELAQEGMNQALDQAQAAWDLLEQGFGLEGDE